MKKYTRLINLPIQLFIILITLNSICYADGDRQPAIPEDVRNRAESFLKELISKPPEIVYRYFDDDLKKEIDLKRLEIISKDIRKVLGDVENVAFLKGSYISADGGLYALSFSIKTKEREFACSVHLKRHTNSVFIRGFNIISAKAALYKSYNFTNATMVHYFVLISFIVCIYMQIYCLIFFLRKKGLKKRWLYVLLSFLGFPFGYGIHWTTGVFIINFGLKFPAVNLARHVDGSDMWSVFVFFPIGVIFMIREATREEWSKWRTKI